MKGASRLFDILYIGAIYAVVDICFFGHSPSEFAGPTVGAEPRPLKPLGWIGSSYKNLLNLPAPVVREFGYALYRAQRGEMAPHAKALKGFGGGSVVEVVENFDTNTYRAIYTVRYRDVVYVLHVFEKKSKTGKATPKTDLDLIKKRLRFAEQEYQRWRGKEAKR